MPSKILDGIRAGHGGHRIEAEAKAALEEAPDRRKIEELLHQSA
jgi:hypothetical protein